MSNPDRYRQPVDRGREDPSAAAQAVPDASLPPSPLDLTRTGPEAAAPPDDSTRRYDGLNSPAPETPAPETAPRIDLSANMARPEEPQMRFAEPTEKIDLSAGPREAPHTQSPEKSRVAEVNDTMIHAPQPRPDAVPARSPEAQAPPADSVPKAEREPQPSGQITHQQIVAAHEGKTVNISDNLPVLKRITGEQINYESKKLADAGEPTTIFAVSFRGPVEQSFLRRATSTDKIQVTQANILDSDGLLNTLDDRQLVEVVADTVRQGDDPSNAARNATLKALDAFNGALPDNDSRDPLTKLRAAVHTARKEFETNEPTTRAERRAERIAADMVSGALTSDVAENLNSHIHEVGNLLDAIEDKRKESQGTSQPPNPNAIVTVFNSGISGTGEADLQQQRRILESALPHIIKQQAAQGEPHRLIIDGPEFLTPAGYRALERLRKNTGANITYLVDPSELTAETAQGLISSGLRVIGEIEDVHASKLVSDALPHKKRTEVDSITHNTAGTTGGSANLSLLKNIEPGSTFASSLGLSGSADANANVSHGVSTSHKVTRLPVALPDELMATRATEVALIDSNGEQSAVFRISGGYIGAFPPPEAPTEPDEAHYVEEAKTIAAIQELVNGLAAPAAQTVQRRAAAVGTSRQGEISTAPLPKDNAARPVPSAQFINGLRSEYGRNTRNLLGGDKAAFVQWALEKGWDITTVKK